MAKRSRGDSSSSLADSQTSPFPSALSPSEAESSHSAKYATLDRDTAELQSQEVMRCSLPPHREPVSFTSYDEFEVHYAKVHVNRCSECGKNFPTEHFLGLHIEENHDPLAEARRAQGERTYGCFVEGCDRKCSAPQKRRRHLIDKHFFPRTYNFAIVNEGIDKRSSLLTSGSINRRRLSGIPGSPDTSRRRRRTLSSAFAIDTSVPQKEARITQNEAEVERSDSSETESSESGDQEDESRGPLLKKHTLSLRTVAAQSEATDENGKENDKVAEIEKSMAALRFIPTSVVLNRKKK